MKRRKRNRVREFYYSHPYLVIFNILIIYNIAIILLFSLLLAYLNDGTINSTNYVQAIQYCAIYTMNSGDIWSDAPTSVVILKIIINTTQMITFSGALIGLATSMLQNLFNRRVHNVGKLKLKNHYVILNWSPIGANLIKELSFMEGKKTIVILSSTDRDSIQEEIDNLFLESGIEKKNIRIFVKNGSPSSRKSLKEISIEKCISIALLSNASWIETNDLTDADAFKILMSVLSINKKANIVVEANNTKFSKQITDLMKASIELNKANISIFSRNSIVGHALGRAAINTSFADLYYYLLSFEGGSFYSIDKPYDVKDALKHYNRAIPITRYSEKDGEKLYLYASYESNTRRSFSTKETNSTLSFNKKILPNNFTLFIIGENDKANAINDVIETHNKNNNGNIKTSIYPIDVNIDLLADEINNTTGRKKILIFSDEKASIEEQDNNVFLTLIKLKTNERIGKDVEMYAEIFDPSSRFSLNSLNINGMIISNEMVALYIAQVLTHPYGHKFYEDLLIKNFEKEDTLIDFDVRRAKELMDVNEDLVFNSKLDFINALYEASNHEYLPIGFVGRIDKKQGIISAVTSSVTNVIDSAKNITDKLVNTISSAISLSDSPTDSPIDKSNIDIMDYNIRKKENITISKDTILILVHYHK